MTTPKCQDRVFTVNGLRLHYLDWGTEGKLPFLLLHGGSAYAHWWDFVAPVFAENFRVIAMDQRGHGDSDHADPPQPMVPATILLTCTSLFIR